jgi:hypothetical protein
MPAAAVRDEARRLVERSPDDATWEDLPYLISARQSIADGPEDVRAGRRLAADEVRRRLGRPR